MNHQFIYAVNSLKKYMIYFVACCFVFVSAFSYAQTWPSKPITLVVPFPAGGATDVIARAVATRLSTVLGQSVVVDYKPGAGATLGAGLVAKSPADGYTLLMGAVHHTIASSVYKNLNYDFQKDFAPITVVGYITIIQTVNSTSPAMSLQDFVSQAKKVPGKLSYGSNGNGTSQNLIGTQFQMLTGTELLHVPYKGSAPLTVALLSGEVDTSFDSVTTLQPHIKSGKLRPLAVIGDKRSQRFPEVPTFREAGYPGINVGTWFGILAPKKTPKEITNLLNREVVKIIRNPEFLKQMEDLGIDVVGNSQEEMEAQIQEETDRFRELVTVGKITVN